jgi:hypothetical protein
LSAPVVTHSDDEVKPHDDEIEDVIPIVDAVEGEIISDDDV